MIVSSDGLIIQTFLHWDIFRTGYIYDGAGWTHDPLAMEVYSNTSEVTL